MCYIIIINIMLSLNITCNTTFHLLSTLCAIFLIFFLSGAIRPLTIIIIITVLQIYLAYIFVYLYILTGHF